MNKLLTLNLLDDEKLAKIHQTTKPLLRREGKLFTIKEGYDLRVTAFTWLEPDKEVKADLVLQKEMHTLHTWSYYGFFKPTVAEVLSCIESFMMAKVVDYYEVIGPQDATDLNEQSLFLNNGLHLAKAKLYWDRSIPDDVRNKRWRDIYSK